MFGFFKFQLVGTCLADVEYTKLPGGKKRAVIAVAVNVPVKVPPDPREKRDPHDPPPAPAYTEKTTFVRVALFDKRAESKMLEFCKKGAPVAIEGNVSSYQHETDGGGLLTMHNFRPSVIRPLGKRPDGPPAPPDPDDPGDA